MRHAFDHFVDDVLAYLGAHEAVAEGLALVEQHVPFAGVQDDFVGKAVFEEGGGGDAGGEVGGVEGDCVWGVEVAAGGSFVSACFWKEEGLLDTYDSSKRSVKTAGSSWSLREQVARRCSRVRV